jgi:hypothetical protein
MRCRSPCRSRSRCMCTTRCPCPSSCCTSLPSTPRSTHTCPGSCICRCRSTCTRPIHTVTLTVTVTVHRIPCIPCVSSASTHVLNMSQLLSHPDPNPVSLHMHDTLPASSLTLQLGPAQPLKHSQPPRCPHLPFPPHLRVMLLNVSGYPIRPCHARLPSHQKTLCSTLNIRPCPQPVIMQFVGTCTHTLLGSNMH